MRNLTLTLLFLIAGTLTGFSQTTLFYEDFETLPLTQVTSSGAPGWDINTRLQVTGLNSDSSAILAAGNVSYLELASFDASGLFNVTLTFNGICKAEFFDGGTLEISTDGGNNWIQLIDNDGNPGGQNNCNYLGFGNFRTQGSRFQEANYGAWFPGQNLVPDNTWWQQEIFDISGLAGNQADVRIRFKFAELNNNGPGNTVGTWHVDLIEVIGAVCELITPTLAQLAPIYPATVYNLGPFVVNADAFDLSGMSSVTLYYSVSGGTFNALPMTNTTGTEYTVTIPAVTAPGTQICYYLEAIDASGCNNTTLFPGPSTSNTICFTAEEGVTFPYCDNFDVAGIPWSGSGSGTGTDWQLGPPNSGALNTAFSSPNSWVTNINGPYGNNANAVLLSPEFSFTVGAGAKLEFWHQRNTEANWDGTRLEWATNINGPWTILGAVGCVDCVNWYNNPALISSGQPGWEGNSNGWVQSSILLDASFNNQPQVWFRYVFTSDGSVTADGMSIDNFCITLPQPDDVGVTTITSPPASSPAGNCVDVILTVKNMGLNTQTNFPVTYVVTQGGTQIATGTGTYNGTLTPGASATLTLPCFTIPQGGFTICAYTQLPGDGNNFNDTTCISSVGVPVIGLSYTNPFSDNFDGTNIGWSTINPSGAPLTQWQLGTPAFGATNSAFSPPNAWDVNINQAYGNNAACELLTPLFDFSTAVDAKLSFWRNSACESGWDGTRLEYSIGGGPWILLGGANLTGACWVNWYNSNPNINSSGQPAWMGNSGGWVKTEANCLPAIFNNNPAPIQFKFTFTSDGSVTQDGFSIDDFRIDIPIPLSAAPVQVNTSAINNSFIFPGQQVTFSAPIRNPGTTPLTSVIATLTIDGVPFSSDTIFYNPALPSAQSLLHNFTQNWTAAPGVYNVCVITSQPNFGLDLNPFDDTTCITISVFDTVTVTSANPYCTDFEAGPQWVSVNAVTYNNALNSWQVGTPSQTIINGAYSGQNAWMTNLVANYPNRDTSGLFTPVFAIDDTKCYRLSFRHKFNSEAFADGGTVEYSTDFAQTWNLAGPASTNNPAWFNTAFITALGGTPPVAGWSGTQSTWELASQDLQFWNTSSVIFRFRFASDNTVNNFEGWSIDDFCFEEVAAPCFVGIADPDASSLVLGQNYPNPFNNNTAIEFAIPSAGQVKLSITNLLGQEIANLVDGQLGAGTHKAEITGKTLSPGIYYYTLDFNNQKLTRKMVVTQ